jgi:hypothetical protein
MCPWHLILSSIYLPGYFSLNSLFLGGVSYSLSSALFLYISQKTFKCRLFLTEPGTIVLLGSRINELNDIKKKILWIYLTGCTLICSEVPQGGKNWFHTQERWSPITKTNKLIITHHWNTILLIY